MTVVVHDGDGAQRLGEALVTSHVGKGPSGGGQGRGIRAAAEFGWTLSDVRLGEMGTGKHLVRDAWFSVKHHPNITTHIHIHTFIYIYEKRVFFRTYISV